MEQNLEEGDDQQQLTIQDTENRVSPSIGGLLSSDGPSNTLFLIDTDDDDTIQDTAQIQPDDVSDCDQRSNDEFEDCESCKFLELSARKAYAAMMGMKKHTEKFNTTAKENEQLRRINGETANYVQELLILQKKLEARNIEVEAELTQEKRQSEFRDAQIKKAYEMMQENQSHLNAANEWRMKYNMSQETLKQVNEMRQRYDDKMSETLNLAQGLKSQLDKSEKKCKKTTDELTGVKSRLKYITDHMPVLLSGVDLLLKKFPSETDIQQKYTKLLQRDVRLVLMGKLSMKSINDEYQRTEEDAFNEVHQDLPLPGPSFGESPTHLSTASISKNESSVVDDLMLSESDAEEEETVQPKPKSPSKASFHVQPVSEPSSPKIRKRVPSPLKPSKSKETVFIASAAMALKEAQLPFEQVKRTSTIHGRKTATIREQQANIDVGQRLAKLRADPSYQKPMLQEVRIKGQSFEILPGRRKTTTKIMEDIEPQDSQKPGPSNKRKPVDPEDLCMMEQHENVKNATCDGHLVLMRKQSMKSSINDEYQRTEQDAFNEVHQDLPLPGPSFEESLTHLSTASISKNESSVVDDLMLSESDAEEEETVQPKPKSPSKASFHVQPVSEPSSPKIRKRVPSPLKPSKSKETVFIASAAMALKEAQLPFEQVKRTSTIHGRKTATIREQQANIDVGQRLAKLRADPSYQKPMLQEVRIKGQSFEILSGRRKTTTASPSVSKNDTFEHEESQDNNQPLVESKSPELKITQDIDPEDRQNLGSSDKREPVSPEAFNMPEQLEIVKKPKASPSVTKNDDLKHAKSQDNNQPLTEPRSSNLKRTEDIEPQDAQKPGLFSNKRKPVDSKALDMTAQLENVKRTKASPSVTKNDNLEHAKSQDDDHQPLVKPGSPKLKITEAIERPVTRRSGPTNKRKPVDLKALSMTEQLENQKKYQTTPESVASQVDNFFQKIANRTSMQKATAALADDCDVIAKTLGPNRVAQIFVKVFTMAEIGNMWISLSRKISKYRKLRGVEEIDVDDLKQTTSKIEYELLEAVNQMDENGELYNEVFRGIYMHIVCQKQSTITQFCSNVRMAFLTLHLNPAMPQEEKLSKSRKLVEFLLYNRVPDQTLSALCFVSLNDSAPLLEWLNEGIDKIKFQICAFLTGRNPEFTEVFSMRFPNAGLKPLDLAAIKAQYEKKLSELEIMSTNQPALIKVTGEQLQFDKTITLLIQELVALSSSHINGFDTIMAINKLIQDSFALIEQWIIGDVNIVASTSFLSDITKLTVGVNLTTLNRVVVHLLLSLAMITDYIRWKSTQYALALMDILRPLEEKIPLFLSRCAQSKMPHDCMSLLKALLRHWMITTKIFTQYGSKV